MAQSLLGMCPRSVGPSPKTDLLLALSKAVPSLHAWELEDVTRVILEASQSQSRMAD